jgi:hypothetical protein
MIRNAARVHGPGGVPDPNVSKHVMAVGKDITGLRCGKLVAVEVVGRSKGFMWRCRCDCGGETILRTNTFLSGRRRGCGCLRGHNYRHGCKPHRLWKTWRGIKQRCNVPAHPSYSNYGKRGISVCAAWQTYEPFRDWALANGWRPGLQINRINNDGNYEPSNCDFVTPKQNSNNRRGNLLLTWKDRTLTAPQWADELGVSVHAIRHRHRKGWPVERIFTQPFA